MAALNTSAGVSGSASTLTSANPSPEPSGSDRYIFGVTAGFFADATSFKHGGSGGTNLGQIGSDITLNSGALTATFWDLAPGPSGTTSAYAAFSAGTANALSAAFYDTVDQTTPAEALQTNTGDNGGFGATQVATITVTGVEADQEVVVGLAIGTQGGPTISSVVAGSNTTVVRSDYGSQSGENLTGTAILRGVAAGTSITLSATITISSAFGDLRWIVGARPLITAAGGDPDPSVFTEAAGVATASTITGSSTAVAAETAAAGAATASTLTGSAQANSTRTAADGVATAGALAGSSSASATATAAAGAATTSTVAATSTAVASFVAAAGVATAATLSSDLGPSDIAPAVGEATASSMTGQSTVVASFVAASGSATTSAIPGSPPAVDATVTGGWGTYYPRKRKRLNPEPALEAPEQIQAIAQEVQRRRQARQELLRIEAKDRRVMEQLRDIYAEQDALARGISQLEQQIAEQIEDDEDVALILGLAG